MSKKIIYLIDDDKIFHFMMKKSIQRIDKEVEVVSFYEADKALISLKKVYSSGNNLPQLIFLDINMPIMNGWEFLDLYEKENNQFSKQMTLYIISSSNDAGDIERANRSKVADFIVKPLRTDLLEIILKKTY